MATSSSPLPMATGPDNRFARYNDDDHSAPIWIASILSLIFAYLILSIRLGFVKWNIHGLDDVLLTIGHLFGLGMTIALFVSLNNDLGKDPKLLSGAHTPQMNQSLFTSRILLFLALTFSKCAVPIFIRNIFSYIKNIKLITNVTIGVVTLWGLAAILTVSVACSPDDIVSNHSDSHCPNDVHRLKAITIVDIITEIAIILLPLMPVCKVQISTRRKCLVMFAFSFRIPNIIITIFHLKSYSKYVHEGRTGTAVALPVIWQSVLLSYNLMSATIPTLKGFMKGFTTGGLGYSEDMSKGTNNSNNSSNSYNMVSLSKVKTKAGLLPEDYPASAACVSSYPKSGSASSTGLNKATMSGDSQERGSIASVGSRRILIRKDWEITTVE